MATPIKRWPTKAEWARQDAVARCQRIIESARGLAGRADVPLDVMRELVLITDLAHQSIRDLNAVRPKKGE